MTDSYYLLGQIESLFVPSWATRNKEFSDLIIRKIRRITGIVTNPIEIFFLERGSSISKIGKKRKKVMLLCFTNDRFILLAI